MLEGCVAGFEVFDVFFFAFAEGALTVWEGLLVWVWGGVGPGLGLGMVRGRVDGNVTGGVGCGWSGGIGMDW